MNSRSKGKRGELELAAFLKERGVDARRGQQFSGGTSSPDVVTALEHVHFECKRVEAGNPYDWLEQAMRDCGGKLPVVAHKRNRKEWIAILPLEELIWLLVSAGALRSGDTSTASEGSPGTAATAPASEG